MILKTNFNSGVLIKSNKRNSLNVLSRNDIINLFLKNGCIIFKGFNLNPKSLLDFTNKFTYIYANDANRRTEVYDKKIKTVDEGNQEMPLHSEASYSPSWPEIIWFYCVKPPKKSGWTTEKINYLQKKKMLEAWKEQKIIKHSCGVIFLKKIDKIRIIGDHTLFIFEIIKSKTINENNILTFNALVEKKIIL